MVHVHRFDAPRHWCTFWPMNVPRTVWTLGAVSLLMDFSSELVHSLLPVFMTTVLGASMLAVGIVEGIAEATASALKAFSGALSDRLRRRKPLLVLGYGLAALSKPLFPLAGSIGLVLGARFMDRIGKGIRGAPRDALIAVAVLVLFVREPEAGTRTSIPVSLSMAGFLGKRYWAIVSLGAVLTLARFSEAFLILRAQELGLALALLPVVLVVMNLAYTAAAYPAGVAADRGHRKALLVWGLLALVVSDVVLASFSSYWLFFLGIILWGAHMGLTQGLLSALVADAAPAELRGTAFGVFHLVSGAALLAASVLAGGLWSAFGAAWTFYAGALFTAVALAGMLLIAKGR